MTHPAPAPVGRRLLAWSLDAAGLVVCGGLLLVAVAPRLAAVGQQGADAADLAPAPVPGGLLVAGWALLVGFGLVQWWTLGTHGWTLGKLAVGLRFVDERTGRPVGPARAFVRGLVVSAANLVCLVGPLALALSVLLDAQGRHRGWHDKAVRAEVVDLRTGSLPPARPRRATLAGSDTAAVRVVVGPAVSGPPPSGRPGPDGHRAPHGANRTGPGASDGTVQDVVARRLGSLLADRRTGSPAFELPPFPAPGVAPDVDTRALPTVRPATTGLDPEVEQTRRAPWGAQEDEGEPPGDPTTAELELNDGRIVVVAHSAFVGRNPTGGPEAQLVRIVDPGRSVSKTHLEIGVDGATVWAMDRGSTNGTLVTLLDGQQIVCSSGARVRLPLGATVSFGDHSLTVVRAPQRVARA